jgi:vitamin B12 transporter
LKKIYFIIATQFFVYNGVAQFAKEDSLEAIYYKINPLIKKIGDYTNKQTIVMDEQAIKNSAATTIDQVLRQVPGIDMKQRGPAGVQLDIGIDGGTFDQSMVLINGIKIPDAQTGHNMFVLPFELPTVRQIQTIKGGAASMYGVNALTGAINIITKQPTKNYLQLGLQSGSSFTKNEHDNLYYNYGGNIRAGLIKRNFSHAIDIGWKQGNGYRKNTAYTTPNFWYETQGNIKSHKLHLMTGYRYMDFGAHSFYAAPGDSNSHETIQNSFIALKHAVPIGLNFYWQNNVIYNYKTDDYKYIQNPVIGRNVHYQNLINLQSNLVYTSSIGNVKLGVESRVESLNSTNLGQHNRNNLGFILNYDVTLRKKLLIDVGLYVNQNSNYGFQMYPNIGVGYMLNDYAKIFGNYSYAQRLPSFTDLYYNQRNVIEGNPDLIPERSSQVEIGYQLNKPTIKAVGYVFYRSIDQFIDWTKNDVSDVWRPNNFLQLNTMGIHTHANKDFILNNKNLMGVYLGYNYLNPAYKITENGAISRYAINALRQHLVSNVYYTIGESFTIQIGANYYERVSYKRYWLGNASIKYNWKQIHLNLSLQNINNEKVIEAGAQPLPGRWLQLGIVYNLL